MDERTSPCGKAPSLGFTANPKPPTSARGGRGERSVTLAGEQPALLMTPPMVDAVHDDNDGI